MKINIKEFIANETKASYLLDDVFSGLACIPFVVNSLSGKIRGLYGLAEVLLASCIMIGVLSIKIFNYINKFREIDPIYEKKVTFLGGYSKELFVRGIWDIGKGAVESIFIFGSIFAITCLAFGMRKKILFPQWFEKKEIKAIA